MANLIIQGIVILALIIGGVVLLALGQKDAGGPMLAAGLAYAAALFQNKPSIP